MCRNYTDSQRQKAAKTAGGDGGGGGGGDKKTLHQFFLTFSFNPFATLV